MFERPEASRSPTTTPLTRVWPQPRNVRSTDRVVRSSAAARAPRTRRGSRRVPAHSREHRPELPSAEAHSREFRLALHSTAVRWQELRRALGRATARRPAQAARFAAVEPRAGPHFRAVACLAVQLRAMWLAVASSRALPAPAPWARRQP